MGVYDLLMLAVMVGSILFGMWKGLAWQVASLASIFVSYIVALIFRGPLSGYISASEPWNKFAAMLIIFLFTSLIIWMAYGYIKKTIKRLSLRGFDRQAGGMLGAVKGVALCMLLTLFSVTLFGDRVRQGVINSRSGGYIAAAINKANAIAPREIHLVLDRHVQQFNEVVTEASPEFLENANAKLDQKIQIFRGHFEPPKARVANVPTNNPVPAAVPAAGSIPPVTGGASGGGLPPQGVPGGGGFQPPANNLPPTTAPPAAPTRAAQGTTAPDDNSFGG